MLLADRTAHSPGQVYLVDFGSVQNTGIGHSGTMTIVGTYGYMPPEQFGGRATPASDLYSLGATLIHLVTGTAPADLPQADLRIQFEAAATLSPAFCQWLQRMTEPSPERRFSSARAALQALEHPSEAVQPLAPLRQPAHSKIEFTKTPTQLEILITPRSEPTAWVAAGCLTPFAIAWNSFIFFWTFNALRAPFPVNLVFSLFSLPFWTAGMGMLGPILFLFFGQLRLRIDQRQIAQTFEVFGVKYHRPRPSDRSSIDQLIFIPKHSVRDSDGDRVNVPAQLVIRAGIREYKLGGTGSQILSNEVELEWLAQELSQWLGLPLRQDKVFESESQPPPRRKPH
jgi:serine/threonine protein kinase